MKKDIVKHGHIDVYLPRDEHSSQVYDFLGMDDDHNHYNVPVYWSVSVSLLRSYYQQMKGPMLLPFCLFFPFQPLFWLLFFGSGTYSYFKLAEIQQNLLQLMNTF